MRRVDDVSQRAVTPAERRNGGNRPRIDWGAAFEYFASDPTRSYGDVARKFAISDTSVRKHAKAGGDVPEGWDLRRGHLLKRALDKAEGRIVRSLEERQKRTVQLIDKMRNALLDAPAKDFDLVAALRALPRYLHYEQLYAGQATDRPDIGEVQAVILAVVRVAGRHVPREQRDVFLEELDEATGGLLELEAGDAA